MRIRSNLRDNLTHKFLLVVERYQSSQLRYREDLRKLLVSRLLTVKSDLTSAEIEKLLQNHSLERHRNIIREMVLKVSHPIPSPLPFNLSILFDSKGNGF